MNKSILTVIVGAALIAGMAFAEGVENEVTNSLDKVFNLFDFNNVPDGVSILALEDDTFKIVSIATAPYHSSDPTAISRAHIVANAKAKASLSRFLNESTSVDYFVEKEMTKVKTISDNGAVLCAQTSARRVLTRIHIISKQLLTGIVVLQTEQIPDKTGIGGKCRCMVGVSPETLKAAGALGNEVGATTP